MKTLQGQSPTKKIKFGLFSPRLRRFLTIREYNNRNFRVIRKNFFPRFFYKKNDVYFKKLSK